MTTTRADLVRAARSHDWDVPRIPLRPTMLRMTYGKAVIEVHFDTPGTRATRITSIRRGIGANMLEIRERTVNSVLTLIAERGAGW